MSLVNDMLRDLDQRRKSSESSGAAVNLMPASDNPVEKKSRSLLIAALALIVVVAFLAYFWMQQSGGVSERQLDIQPRVVSNSSPEEATPAVDDSIEADVEEEAASETPAMARDAMANGATDAPVILPVENIASGSAAAEPASAAGEGVAADSGANHDIATGFNTHEDGNDDVVQSVAETDSVTNQQATNSESSQQTIDIRNQAPNESIKTEARMSAEELDTLAVQKALQLIADSDVAGAYAHLEQHIINNRYAHQSRETYAKLLINEGELLDAYNLIESGLALAPNHPGYKKVKARVLIADGQIKEAVELLSRRAPAVSDDIEYHEILATAQLASRDYEGASLSYTSLVQQDRSQGRWWYGFAVSQDSMGKHQVARQAYSRALQQGNLSPNLRRRSLERLTVLNR